MGEAAAMTDRLRIAIWLDELGLPFDDGLRVAAEVGSEYVWFTRLPGETAIADMTDAEVDDMARRVEASSRKLFTIGAGHVFHNLRLTDLAPGRLREHEGFCHDFDALVRSMEIAARLGVGGVCAYAFHWPGEGTGWQEAWSRSPTWPMRWATGGGIVSEAELRGLVEVFRRVLEAAEKHDVDVLVNQRPFHYTNTTAHFLELAERVGSGRLKAFWGPADNVLSGEREVPTRGYERLRAYLAAVHLKDVQVHDGARGEYAWKPIGDGEVGYSTLFRRLVEEDSDAVLAVATHFLPPGGGSTAEAMAINHERVTSLLARVRREVAAARHKESHP